MSVEQAHKETTDATSSMRHRTIGAILQESRTSLLDLTLRNRLLNIPKQSKSTTLLTIHHALSADLFRILVQEKKSMSFLPKLDKKDGEIACADDEEMIARNRDRSLPTMLTAEILQKRLLGMYYDARTLEEEQGVNILYLTLGTIKWYESDSSDRELYAPLLLIPVTLTRSTAKEQFHLSWREEDVSINLSLYTKMNMEFGCVLPELPPHDEIDISAYMRHVAESISSKKRWEIKEQDITLGFYSFAKFLMFRDLDVDLWPDTTRLDAHPLVAGLLGDGFPSSKEFLISEDSYVDDHLSIQEMYHVVDADSSQTVAIYEVLKGRDLVIQGPPGTGKSQTIANIIAGAVIQGKKVLFIAEKMAALEVVYRRLQYVGLDAMCLELHSHKSNKRHVLEELKKTMELGSPRGYDQGKSAKATAAYGAKLRDYALKLHSPLHPSGFTPYEIIGRLIALKNKGIDATAIVLSQPESWDSADYQQHKHLLADIAARLKQSGSMNKNPWRGVQCSSLSPKESQKLDSLLTQVTQQFHLMMTLAETIERHFPARNNATIGDFKKTHDLCRAYMALPHINIECIAQSAWIDNIQAVRDLLVTGQRFQELDTLISSVFKDIAKQHDFSECHQHLVMYGDSMLGVVHGKYRSSKKILASMLVGTLPKAHKEQLDVLEAMMSWQRAYKELEQHDAYGRELFGVHWKSHRTDWEQCTRLLEWRMGLSDTLVNLTLFKAFASIPSRDLIASMYEEYTTCVDDCTQQLEKLCALLDIDFPLAFGVESLEHVPRKAIKERLEAWSEHREGLLSYITLRERLAQAFSNGMGSLILKVMNDTIDSAHLLDTFDRAFYDALIEKVFTDCPEWRNLDADHLTMLVAQFREHDLQRIEQARIEVAAFHHSNLPTGNGSTGTLRVLKGEFAKKRNHLPIRTLIKSAAPAIQAIKPVFMMSPLSVAQFLEPAAIDFDLLVIDEASQVEPIEALGAIARCKQMVVVGDNKQLPPTRFFSKMTSNDEDNPQTDDDEYSVSTKDVESILSLCEAQNLATHMLRWHYRSKHPSLIAVSNREFYDHKLYIVPSPYESGHQVGLRFHHIQDGMYDSGGSRANATEAQQVAEAVMHHARTTPEQSLGVVAFSVKQRQAIMDALELLRRHADPIMEAFFQRHPNEPFFVKNLENVQGDERDVIYISVGYARNQQGYLAMRFGPLSAEGGERRLNVLISRAKCRCEVFASITADDIDLERAKGVGVYAFKLFLHYAATGQLSTSIPTGNDADSPFEEEVAAALRSRGYDVHHQIGTAGFFIDLAIKDPNKAGRFVLGIECDGAAYHSSRSARDRDRLRQQVLEAHGWIIHRIWSTDWFRRPQDQLEKTIQAIEAAKLRILDYGKDHEPMPLQPTITRNDPKAHASHRATSLPYEEARFAVATSHEPHELSDEAMAAILAKIITCEAPIHEEVIIHRVRILWNLGRAGTRIRQKVQSGLRYAEQKGIIKKEEGMCIVLGKEIKPRDRSSVEAAVIRKPEFLPPQEIRAAILSVVTNNFGADHEALAVEVARLLGFQSTSIQLRELIETQIQTMISAHLLHHTGTMIVLKE